MVAQYVYKCNSQKQIMTRNADFFFKLNYSKVRKINNKNETVFKSTLIATQPADDK